MLGNLKNYLVYKFYTEYGNAIILKSVKSVISGKDM